jgi:tetratricopeptide (TPR) repeat protein
LDLTSTPLSWYRGMAWFYSGNLSAAAAEYQSAYEVNPWHIRVLNDYATVCEQNGDRTKAIKLYNQALQITPLFVEGNLNLSAAYYNEKKNDSALIVINRLYKAPMANDEKKTYTTFLNAILRNQILTAQSVSDSILKRKYEKFLTTHPDLTPYYFASRTDSGSFAKKVADAAMSE